MGNAASAKLKRRIDPNQLTPGVETMYFIRDAVEYWVYSRLQNDSKYRHVTVYLSGPDVPGEGELKIIDHLRTQRVPQHESVVIIGGDADIVLQALATSHIRNLFVYLRHYKKKGKTKHNYIISLWQVVRQLEITFGNHSSPRCRLDLIVMAMLTGNDYLPKLRGVSLGRLWKRYLALKVPSKTKNAKSTNLPFRDAYLIDADNRTFNWPFLHALLDNVGAPVKPIDVEIDAEQRSEVDHHKSDGNGTMDEEVIVYNGNETGVPMEEFVNFAQDWMSEDDSDDEDYAPNSDDDDDDDDEYDYDDDMMCVDENAQHLETLAAYTDNGVLYDTERWLRTVLWTLQMYIDGVCPDYHFQYARPYAPSCHDIADYVQKQGVSSAIHASVSAVEPLQPHIAAFAMLPSQAIGLLPVALQSTAKDKKVVGRIFSRNAVDVAELIRVVGEVDLTKFSAEEKARMVHMAPVALRVAWKEEMVRGWKAKVKRPSEKFEKLRKWPIIVSKTVANTKMPPCHSWTLQGENALLASFIRVPGRKLQDG